MRSDLQFLHGRALARAIVEALKGERRDLAVAYFGKGAMQRLGLKAPKGARILCDFWSGCCNPFEIELLIRGGADIRDSRGLNAKVYIGSEEAVVASANASANGLGLEGDEVTDRPPPSAVNLIAAPSFTMRTASRGRWSGPSVPLD